MSWRTQRACLCLAVTSCGQTGLGGSEHGSERAAQSSGVAGEDCEGSHAS